MIGLDTGHLVHNYGTKLQAYAMQTLLESNGEKCEIIQWHKKGNNFSYGIINYIKRLNKIHKLYKNKISLWPKIYKRYKAFDKFNKKFNIKRYYGNFEEMKEYLKNYSIVFCGSDQAWLPENVKNHYYTLEYCDDTVFKAAYAPSFGVDKIEKQYQEMYFKFLSKMDSISVREISGQKIIKDIIGKDVPVVLDPTLLVQKEVWDDLYKESRMKKIKDKYVFCYLLGENEQHREIIKKIAKENNLKIVNLQHFSKYNKADENFGDYNLFDVSPQDFIYLIANSELVCTDSFHCTVFSIHYKKNFWVFRRFKTNDKMSTNTRIYSLLGQLGLEDRIVNHNDIMINENIFYDDVYEKLEKMKVISAEYMKNAMGGKKNV